jgi:hypothetical protein
MRLSIRLDDDIYRVAKSMALAEQCSISSAVNELLRRSLFEPAEPGRALARRKGRRGIVVSKGARPFGNEDVKEIEMLDDMDAL